MTALAKIPALDLSKLSRPEKERALTLLREKERRKAQRLFYALYGEEDTIWDGPALLDGLIRPGQTLYRRGLYPKHMEFFTAGALCRERLAMCANRVGKTFG